MPKKQEKILRLILGDQLNIQHSWFSNVNENVVYLMMEIKQESEYVRHHLQKILAFFISMRNFNDELIELGHSVIYLHIHQQDNLQNLKANLKKIIEKGKFTKFEYQLPDEYRLDEQLRQFCSETNIEYHSVDTEHFFSERNELSQIFKDKLSYRMENFYRHMRKKHGILMEANGKDPIQGKWNFDSENRKKLPKDHNVTKGLFFKNEFAAVEEEIKKAGIQYIGKIESKHLSWPVNRNQSLELLKHFCKKKLFLFGTYQDAMSKKEFDLYHSRLSFALNVKLIHPKEVIDEVITYWNQNKNEIEFNQVEGFVRQILGWREYMRGVYWAQMPEYRTLNFFNNKNKLPAWFWTGETKMKCLSHSISQSLETAYAHHIQRLMITGNFSLLAGIHPDAVDEWYLGIYIDAIEWVEITNTRGMSQYADGGLLASKPYVSSGAYIQKMSDYCENCVYNVKTKTDKDSCPFNSLYWNFIDLHKDKLKSNQRMSMIYSVWEKMNTEDKHKVLLKAEEILNGIEDL